MSMQRLRCSCCGSRNLRPSHIRLFYDVIQFLMLRWPVRCRRCRERFHVNIRPAKKLRNERNALRENEKLAPGPHGKMPAAAIEA
jgi:hypothetical protein